MSFSHHAVLVLLFFLIGCSVGSFLNVCAYRIPLGMSLLRPRSRCPRCQTAIRACHNIPVLGWLLLRGRCRECGGSISLRYPAVELLTGLSFGGVYLAWVAFAPADLWEQSGAPVVLIRLLLLWSVIGIALVGALVCYDSLGCANRDHSPLFPRASELRSGAGSVERSDGGDGDLTRALAIWSQAPSQIPGERGPVVREPSQPPEMIAETPRSRARRPAGCRIRPRRRARPSWGRGPQRFPRWNRRRPEQPIVAPRRLPLRTDRPA